MTKDELIAVYQNTKGRCADIEIPLSEKLYKAPSLSELNSYKGEIIVEPLDTVSAAIKYVGEGKTAVLNMASNKRKGGGVEKGAMAQEECLFRCSNLFTIPDEFYPLEKNEFIYTHQATFIKSGSYETMWPMCADVITIAAPNLNQTNKYYNASDSENYEELMNKKINAMLDAAASNECLNIILGAWGCGVFKNDPIIVANLFKSVLNTKRYLFDKVIFAVINDHNSVANNYQIFADTFKDNG